EMRRGLQEQLPVLLGKPTQRLEVISDAVREPRRGAPEDQVRHALRVADGVTDGERSGIHLGEHDDWPDGHPLDDGLDVALEGVEGERGDGAVGEPEASRIVLHQSVAARQPLEPPAITGLLPLELDVPGRERWHPDDGRPPAALRVRDPYAV